MKFEWDESKNNTNFQKHNVSFEEAMPNFEYSPQGFKELKSELKAGKIIRNPFAKFYGEKVEVAVVQDKDTDKLNA